MGQKGVSQIRQFHGLMRAGGGSFMKLGNQGSSTKKELLRWRPVKRSRWRADLKPPLCFEARFCFKRRNTGVGSLLTASYGRRGQNIPVDRTTQRWEGRDGFGVCMGRMLSWGEAWSLLAFQPTHSHGLLSFNGYQMCREKMHMRKELYLSLTGPVALGGCFNDSDHRLPQHTIVFIGLRVSQIILFLLMGKNIFNFYEANFFCMQSECLTVYGPCIIIAIVTHLLVSIQLHRLFGMMYNL